MASVLRSAVGSMLIILPLLLGVIWFVGNSATWLKLVPRIEVLAFLLLAALCLYQPKWSLPGFIIALGPLQVFSFHGRIMIGDYPFTLFSMAVWALPLCWLLRVPRLKNTKPDSLLRWAWGWLWFLMLGMALIPIWYDPNMVNDLVMTKLILYRGVVEGFIVFLVTRAWMRRYNDIGTLKYAFFLSVVVGLILGCANYAQQQILDLAPTDVSMFRFNFMAFGGANFTGFFLVMVFPFAFSGIQKGEITQSFLLAFVVMGVALASLSRTTPVVLALETAAFAIPRKTRKLAILLIGFSIFTLMVSFPFLPQEYTSYWWDRWQASDAIGLVLGSATKVDIGDGRREDMKLAFWKDLPKYPFGGYGHAEDDAENIYLDTSMQLGWGPGICLILLQGLLVFAVIKRALKFRNGRDEYGLIMLFLVFGEVVYSYAVGLNLNKVVRGELGIGTNSLPAIVLAIMGALCLAPFISSEPDCQHSRPKG